MIFQPHTQGFLLLFLLLSKSKSRCSGWIFCCFSCCFTKANHDAPVGFSAAFPEAFHKQITMLQLFFCCFSAAFQKQIAMLRWDVLLLFLLLYISKSQCYGGIFQPHTQGARRHEHRPSTQRQGSPVEHILWDSLPAGFACSASQLEMHSHPHIPT